jgi:ArsR family transcriptional regulator
MRGRFRIGDDLVVELAETFRLMSDPTRLKIILACRDAPAAVNEMAEKLGISPSLVSHHLRLLRAARLLQADRRGRQVFYVVGDEHIRSMLADMVDHISEEEAADGAPLWSAQIRASRGKSLRGAMVKILKRRDFHDR